MTDFKFEIGEEVLYGVRKQKVNYRYAFGKYNRFVVTCDEGETVVAEEHLRKLPKPKKKVRVELCLNVYNDRTTSHSCEESAHDWQEPNRLACVPFVWEGEVDEN